MSWVVWSRLVTVFSASNYRTVSNEEGVGTSRKLLQVNSDNQGSEPRLKTDRINTSRSMSNMSRISYMYSRLSIICHPNKRFVRGGS